MWASSLLFGSLVGFSLGLTGGGGSLFAVPLLVFGLGVAYEEAVAVSLAAVGATALAGVLMRWRSGDVVLGAGLLFAAGGMAGAPLGKWLADLLSKPVLLSAFALLMVVVAVRMWTGSSTKAGEDTAKRDAARLNVRTVSILTAAGVATGVLAGMFGVGGGVIIVPALVWFAGMSIHRAIATSLLVIALVSLSGVTSHLIGGTTVAWQITAVFVAGGVGGMFLGNRLGRRMPGLVLQRVFAVAIVAVAVFVIGRTFA